MFVFTSVKNGSLFLSLFHFCNLFRPSKHGLFIIQWFNKKNEKVISVQNWCLYTTKDLPFESSWQWFYFSENIVLEMSNAWMETIGKNIHGEDVSFYICFVAILTEWKELQLFGKWTLRKISNKKFWIWKPCGSIRVVQSRLRWLGHVLWMKNGTVPKIVLFGHPSRSKRKAGRPQLGWEYVEKKDIREMGISCEGVKRYALNRFGWRRRVRRCVGLRWHGAAVSC